MEANNTEQAYFDDAVPLTEPHFDEEATVLSARPVVPLAEIKEEERSRKRLLMGLAMAGSLMLGALATSFVYKQRAERQSEAVDTAVPGVAGIAADQPVNSSPTTGTIRGTVGGSSPEGEMPGVKKKLPPSIADGATPIVVETKPSISPSQEWDEREVTRFERINERRLRRRVERQARRDSGERQRKSDDLLRIREIFEGPARP